MYWYQKNKVKIPYLPIVITVFIDEWLIIVGNPHLWMMSSTGIKKITAIQNVFFDDFHSKLVTILSDFTDINI